MYHDSSHPSSPFDNAPLQWKREEKKRVGEKMKWGEGRWGGGGGGGGGRGEKIKQNLNKDLINNLKKGKINHML